MAMKSRNRDKRVRAERSRQHVEHRMENLLEGKQGSKKLTPPSKSESKQPEPAPDAPVKKNPYLRMIAAIDQENAAQRKK